MTIRVRFLTDDNARLIVDEMTFSGKNACIMAGMAETWGEDMGYIVLIKEV